MIIKKPENFTNRLILKIKFLSDLSIFISTCNYLMPKWKNISLKESLNKTKDWSLILQEDLDSAKFIQITQELEEER